MIFCAAEGAAAAMREAGIEVVTLANNHIRNYGARGETETREILTEAGVARVSEGELLIMPIAGMRVGIIADDDVNQPLDMKQWVTKITAAAAQVDHLLVALHFGAEYRYQPLSRQQELAWLAIDSGARIVVGNHAHWLEPVEFYGEGAIIYAHGNFVFDQMWSEETRQGVVVGWTLARDKLQKVEIYPVYISEYGKVDLVSGTAKGEQILRRMQEISGDGVLEEGKLVMRPEK
jgi:poly-gamma-glutamate synthesis protein (capsule biosynthesis protein)